MNGRSLAQKRREWLRRYVPAEILGTVIALGAAWLVYRHTGSYAGAAATGWAAEGIGFYGYFISLELFSSSKRSAGMSKGKRIIRAIKQASTNLAVEFLPAEILDNFIVRPYTMYIGPQLIHPYPVGFLVGKLSADVLFYALSIVGYETRKHWVRP